MLSDKPIKETFSVSLSNFYVFIECEGISYYHTDNIQKTLCFVLKILLLIFSYL